MQRQRLLIVLSVLATLVLGQLALLAHAHDIDGDLTGGNCQVCLHAPAFDAAVLPDAVVFSAPVLPLAIEIPPSNAPSASFLTRFYARAPPALLFSAPI